MTKTSSQQPSAENKGRQLAWRAVSALLTIVLLFFLLRNVKWEDFSELLPQLSLWSLSVALFSYLALNFFRAIRFRILLDKGDTPLRLLVPITLYHNFLVRIVPYRLGELSYIVLLRSRLNYSMEEGVSSLFGARILEFLIIVMVFATGFFLGSEQFAQQRSQLILVIVLAFAAIVVGLYFAGDLTRLLLRILQRFLAHFTIDRIGWIKVIQDKLLELAAEFDRIRHPRLFLSALFISCFTYTSSFMINYILLRELGLDVELPIVITIISIGMFGAALPSISGFGTIEGAWLFGLTQFADYPVSKATAIGFLLHGFLLAAAALYGLVGYLLIHLSPPLAAAGDSEEA